MKARCAFPASAFTLAAAEPIYGVDCAEEHEAREHDVDEDVSVAMAQSGGVFLHTLII